MKEGQTAGGGVFCTGGSELVVVACILIFVVLAIVFVFVVLVVDMIVVVGAQESIKPNTMNTGSAVAVDAIEHGSVNPYATYDVVVSFSVPPSPLLPPYSSMRSTSLSLGRRRALSRTRWNMGCDMSALSHDDPSASVPSPSTPETSTTVPQSTTLLSPVHP